MTSVKMFEAQRAVEEGANEVGLSLNMGRVKSKKWEYVRHEITKVNEVYIITRK